MAYSDFILKTGLQVSSNIVVGNYAGNVSPIPSGIISTGNVGIGTSHVPTGSMISVIGGNINLNFNGSGTGYGVIYSDGSFQTTAYVGVNYSNANVANFLSGSIIIGNATITNSTISTGTGNGALTVAGGVGIDGNLNVGGQINLFTNKIGVGTNAPLGPSNNILTIYGSTNQFGNIILGNLSTGESGIYFADGTFQTTATISGPTGPQGNIGITGNAGPTGTNALGNVSVTGATNNEIISYSLSSNAWINTPAIYDIAITIGGGTLSNEILLQHILPVPIKLQSGLSGSYAIANSAAASTTIFTMNKNSSSIGTITWAPSATNASFSFTSNVNFSSGDILQIVAPDTPDSELANIGITIAGTRS